MRTRTRCRNCGKKSFFHTVTSTAIVRGRSVTILTFKCPKCLKEGTVRKRRGAT